MRYGKVPDMEKEEEKDMHKESAAVIVSSVTPEEYIEAIMNHAIIQRGEDVNSHELERRSEHPMIGGQYENNSSPDMLEEQEQLPYKPDYTTTPRAPPDETIIDIGGGWAISGSQLDLRDPRVLAIAEPQWHFLEEEYDDCAAASTSSAAFCRSIILIWMALLLLRHTLSLDNGSDGDNDASALFLLFLLKAAGFLLPCYIMAWAISILQRQRFFFKSQVIGTNKLDINYAWVTKAELLEYFPEHAPLFDKMLINIK